MTVLNINYVAAGLRTLRVTNTKDRDLAKFRTWLEYRLCKYLLKHKTVLRELRHQEHYPRQITTQLVADRWYMLLGYGSEIGTFRVDPLQLFPVVKLGQNVRTESVELKEARQSAFSAVLNLSEKVE